MRRVLSPPPTMNAADTLASDAILGWSRTSRIKGPEHELS